MTRKLCSEFYQTFKKELKPNLLPQFQKIREEKMFLSSFCETSITLISKSDKNTADISAEHRGKDSSTKYQQTQHNNTLKKISHHNQARFIPGIQTWFNIHKPINVIYHTNKGQNKNNMIISYMQKKQLTTSIHEINTQQSEFRGNIPQHNKGHI